MNPFKKTEKSVSVFITAGYPETGSLTQQILSLQEQGIDFLEIGIPFSDPMADGPVIQETSMLALKNGMTLPLLLEQLEAIKDQVNIPLVLMGYLNPILQFGLETFLEKCEFLGISGLIIPDLSYELAHTKYRKIIEKSIVPFIYLVTPHTSDKRVSRIAEASPNAFVYLAGQNSITGSSYSLQKYAVRYKQLKQICGEVPLFLGFGISTADQKKEAFHYVDGVIVGSAYLKAISEKKQVDFIEKLLS